MKILYFVVEGDTEEQFVKNNLEPYFEDKCFVQAIKITTNPNLGKRGGFSTYKQLKKDVENLLRQRREKIVTTFVDYFRIPKDIPDYSDCQKFQNTDDHIKCLEDAIRKDIGSDIFFPYIQKHEFEALLFSSNRGFESFYEKNISNQTAQIIEKYSNPEEINDNPNTSPSNRLKQIVPEYNKILAGNIIALEIGLGEMVEKCPRFKNWIENLALSVQN